MSDIPDWAQGSDDSLHNFPGDSGSAVPDANPIQSLISGFFEAIFKKLVMTFVGVLLPGDAQAQLKAWVDVLLPAQIKGPIAALVNLLITALDLIPIFGPLAGDAVEYLADIFGLLDDNTTAAQTTADGAQDSADTANVGVAQLAAQLGSSAVPGGVAFNDTFLRSGSSLGSNYDQSDSGPAGGTLATDGSNAYITPTGANVTTCMARIVVPLATDYQALAIVQDSAISGDADPCTINLILRCNAAKTDYVVAIVNYATVEIGIVVAGAYTQLDAVSCDQAGGDLWTFKVGTVADVRQFQLFRNNGSVPVLQATDTGGTSLVGSSNLYPAFAERTGQAFFFFIVQVAPPRIQSISAYDRPAAA